MTRAIMVIGFGAMARMVVRELPGEVRLACLLVRREHVEHVQARLGPGTRVVSDPGECAGEVDFALECAGHGAVSQYGPALLASGVDFGVVSIGALADDDLLASLEAAARAGNAQLHVLAGAVAGIDALTAARAGGLDEVTYTSRKPPASWRGTPAASLIDLDGLKEATTFFEGTARDAARDYPANANVAATVALAGLGFDDTSVRLIADPMVSANMHTIHARGAFGEFRAELTGRPLPDNPKTSTLAALSALRALRNRGGWLVI